MLRKNSDIVENFYSEFDVEKIKNDYEMKIREMEFQEDMRQFLIICFLFFCIFVAYQYSSDNSL